MRVVTSVAELLDESEPARCYRDRHFLCWGTREGLGGHAVWGAPDRGDAERFVATLEELLARPDLHPRRLIADFRGLVSVDRDAFGHVRDHVRRNRERIVALGIREAVLRPEGLVGSIVAGFYEVVTKPVEGRTFTEAAPALAWLGHPDAGELFSRIEAVQAEGAGAGPILGKLVALLDATPSLSLRDAARGVRLSTRSLQRYLGIAGRSFREVQAEARLRRARELLAGDAKLLAIALEVGFASAQHFATWFKQQTGETPAEWRLARFRRTPGA